VAAAICCYAQVPKAASTKKHVLFIGQSVGFTHDSISHGMYTLAKLGVESGLFDVTLRTDVANVTKKRLTGNAKNLDYFDAVFLYTTGDLPMDDSQKADFLSFIRDDGKALLGTHSATDTFFQWPEYGELVGGYFNEHPWHQLVGVKVEDRSFPATRHFPPRFEITDEIYQFKNYSRDRVRVLMSIDNGSIDLTKKGVKREDKDFAVAWARNYGKGRVFYCSLGHRDSVWDTPDIQKMWLEALRWGFGLVPGDATPRPRASN
jgi:type 1 glutamine amidotransferase